VGELTVERSQRVRELELTSRDDMMNPLVVDLSEKRRSRTEGESKGSNIVVECTDSLIGPPAGTDALRVAGIYMSVAG